MQAITEIYPRTAAERAMKLQEVLLRATARKIKWWQAAELMDVSSRQLRRCRKRLEEQGAKEFRALTIVDVFTAKAWSSKLVRV